MLTDYIGVVIEAMAFGSRPGPCKGCDEPVRRTAPENGVAYRVYDPPGAKRSEAAVLYSFGNGYDMDIAGHRCKFLAERYGATFVCWDPPGYGHTPSVDVPSEKTTNDAAMAVFRCLMANKYKRLYVWGHSLGSSPTCHLASHFTDIAGVVLESPVASAFHVRWHTWLYALMEGADRFNNVGRARRTGFFGAKTFITYPARDEVVAPENAKLLYDALRASGNSKAVLFGYEGRGHNDSVDDVLEIPHDFFLD